MRREYFGFGGGSNSMLRHMRERPQIYVGNGRLRACSLGYLNRDSTLLSWRSRYRSVVTRLARLVIWCHGMLVITDFWIVAVAIG